MDRRSFLRRALAAAAVTALPGPRAPAATGVCTVCGGTNGSHRSWCSAGVSDEPIAGKFYELRSGDSISSIVPAAIALHYSWRIDERGQLVVTVVNPNEQAARVGVSVLGLGHTERLLHASADLGGQPVPLVHRGHGRSLDEGVFEAARRRAGLPALYMGAHEVQWGAFGG